MNRAERRRANRETPRALRAFAAAYRCPDCVSETGEPYHDGQLWHIYVHHEKHARRTGDYERQDGRHDCRHQKGGAMTRRIQLSRAKGWRKPASAVVVSRPTRWGNPFPVIDGNQAAAVEQYRRWLPTSDLDLEPLRGKDLACWCKLDQPCHADVLLELANG